MALSAQPGSHVILLVDRDRAVLNSLTSFLALEGFRVRFAATVPRPWPFLPRSQSRSSSPVRCRASGMPASLPSANSSKSRLPLP
jgi:hypothetical protein